MKLKDVQSKELLPSWAVNAEWLQNGLDLAVRSISARIPGMGAPFTLDAVKALSNEELEALYEQIGVVKYYPDLSRSTRENFIFEIYTNARYLGTPAVVEKLIKYIFDGQPVNVIIHDNLAFDSSGSLVDRSLLDTYDIELNIPVANLPALVLSRLYENLYNLVRNTQKLRGVAFTFDEENIDCNIYFGIIPSETPGITVDIENDAVCDMPPSPQITVITLYMAPNSRRNVQPNVINTSSPNLSYCYQMYTSESVQDDSTKFTPDPTKNYINGNYSSQTGEWVDSTSKYDVSQMPDSTGGDEVELRQVLDNGRLWLGTNKTLYWYTNLNTVRFRVVDKP